MDQVICKIGYVELTKGMATSFITQISCLGSINCLTPIGMLTLSKSNQSSNCYDILIIIIWTLLIHEIGKACNEANMIDPLAL